MRHISLFRSSGFRLAMTFTALFLAATAVASTTAFSVIRQELVNRHERMLREQFDFLVSTYGGGDLEDLTAAVNAYAGASRNQDSVLLLQDAAGEKIAGNIDRVPAKAVNGQTAAADLGLAVDFNYFVRQGQIGGNRLTIATSAEDISELEEIMREGAAWAAVVLLAISLAGGTFLARRMDRRIAEVKDGLERVSEGDFTSRVPISGRGDDIDTLAGMMNTSIERLGASVESMRQISNDISHDLKTPLTLLRINIEQATENYADGLPIRPDLAEAHAETDRIIATFDALLRIAQLETGARKARFTNLEIAPLVADIAEFYQASFEDAGMELTTRIAETVPAVLGDPELLTQLIVNLLENAMRHCAPGSHVVCTVAEEADAVVLRIADNGTGIPADEREKVLRRLYRLEKSRSTPGSGLGLSMVKAIADLHGAALSLGDNKPGLVVAIRFPPALNDGAVGERGFDKLL